MEKKNATHMWNINEPTLLFLLNTERCCLCAYNLYRLVICVGPGARYLSGSPPNWRFIGVIGVFLERAGVKGSPKNATAEIIVRRQYLCTWRLLSCCQSPADNVYSRKTYRNENERRSAENWTSKLKFIIFLYSKRTV